MKIVHLNFSFTVGGIDLMMVDIMNYQSLSHQVSLVVVNDQIDDLAFVNLDKKIEVHKIQRPVGSKNPLHVCRLNLLLKNNDPDVVHCHNSGLIKLLFLKKYKCVLTVHDVGYPTKLYKKYDKVFAISEAVKADILKSCNQLNVDVVLNGVPIESIKKRSESQGDGLSLRFVVVSRLVHVKKGQDLLIEALGKMRAEGKLKRSFSLDIIGAGPSLDYLKGLVEKNGLRDCVTFLGSIGRAEMYDRLCEYDCLIQPSRYEGFGLTVVEAMVARISVIVSDIDGPYEIVEGGKFGHTFVAGDVSSLVEVLRGYIQGYDSREELGMIARAAERAERLYGIKNVVSRYTALYAEL